MGGPLRSRRARTTRAGERAEATQDEAPPRSRGARGLSDARAEYNASIELIRQHDADTQLVAAGISAEIALSKALGGGYVRDDANNNDNTKALGAVQP